MSPKDPKFVPNPCSSRTRASTSAGIIQSSPSSSRTKLPCIFCTDGVPQEKLNTDENHAHNREFRKMLKALYRNFEMSTNDVPSNCTENMFPFCIPCKDDVASIYRQQCKIDEAKKHISKAITNIEKSVAEMELLKPQTVVKAEKYEHTKLTDKILERIRCKLMMQKVLRKSGKVMNNSVATISLSSSNIDIKGSTIRGQFESAKNNLNITFPKLSNDGASSSSQPTPSVVNAVVELKMEQPEEMDVAEGVIGEYDENSCTMTISDVRSESERGSGPSTPATVVQEHDEEEEDAVIVKEETGSPSCGTRSGTRRFIYRGVSIYRISTPIGNSLQCGACQLLVPIADVCYPGSSPYDMMTQHIMIEHPSRGTAVYTRKMKAGLRQQAILTGRRTRSRSTVLASNGAAESLPATRRSQMQTRKAYDNPTNFYQQFCRIMECDICGKPIRGARVNMLAHKFSHKNDEERAIAIAANEPGSRYTMLSRNGVGLNKKKKAATGGGAASGVSRRRRGKYRKRSNFGSSDGGVPKISRKNANNYCEWNCDLCFRVFHKQNHYTNHMKMHARNKDHVNATWATPSTSRACDDATVAARVPREFLYACNAKGEKVIIGEKRIQ